MKKGYTGRSTEHSLNARGVKTKLNANGKTPYPEKPISKMNSDEKIIKAFENIEELGILARANFMCCQTCGSANLADLAEKENKAGFIFWHQQGEDSYRNQRRNGRPGQLYLYFTGMEDSKNPQSNGKSTLWVAQQSVEEFKKVGLKVEWGGKESTAILLKDL